MTCTKRGCARKAKFENGTEALCTLHFKARRREMAARGHTQTFRRLPKEIGGRWVRQS